MDSNYLLQLDYRQHRPDHPEDRHLYSTSLSSDDPQFWSYSYPSRYFPSQCDPQPDNAAPFVYDPATQTVDDFAAPTRLGIFDISAMHAPVGSAQPWGPPNEGQPRLFSS